MNLKIYIPILVLGVSAALLGMYFLESAILLALPFAILGMFIFFLNNAPEKRWMALSAIFCVFSLLEQDQQLQSLTLIVGVYVILNPIRFAKSFKILWKIDLMFLTYYLGLIVLTPSRFVFIVLIFHFLFLLGLHLLISLELPLSVMIGKVTNTFHHFWILLGFIEFVQSSERLAGPQDSATSFGVMLVVSWAIMVLYWAGQGKGILKILLWSSPSLLILIATGTRMCLVGIGLTFFMLFIHNPERKKVLGHILKVTFTKGLPIIILSIVYILSPWGEVILSRISGSSDGMDLSTLGRFLAWYTAWEAFQGNMLFGIGQGEAFLAYLKLGIPESVFLLIGGSNLIHAHNIFLTILSETGLWGFVHMIAILFWAYKGIATQSGENIQYKTPLYLSLCLLLGLGLLDNIPLNRSNLFYGVWILALYLVRAKNTEVLNYRVGNSVPLNKGIEIK